MRRLLTLLVLLLPVLPAAAEEKAGTTCDLVALVDKDDAGLLVAYDGLRKGLEIARLPRVCQHTPTDATGGITGFLERQAMAAAPLREAGKRIDPIFVVGDRSSAAVQAAGTRLPTVMAVTRYTAKRTPIVPLPRTTGAVVYADVPVERVGTLMGEMVASRTSGSSGDGAKPHLVMFSRDAGHLEPTYRQFADNYTGAVVFGIDAGGELRLPEKELYGDAPLVPALLQLGGDVPTIEFSRALKLSRTHKLPLVSDNRAHFGLGAVVVIVPRHDLLGKAAADEGRKLRADPNYKPTTRVVPGFEVWVDLAAADAIGFDLPLSFLARADRIKRGRPKPRKAKGVTR